MSRNNEEDNSVASGSKPLPNDKSDSNHRAGVENISETDAVLPDLKNDSQVKEVAIDLEDGVKHLKGLDSLDYLIYGYCGQQIRPQKTTWVFFQGMQAGNAVPDDQSPLEYDPSSRNGFVRLTLSIVLVMILLTAGFVTIVLTSEDLSHTFRTKGMLLALPAMLVMIGLSYAIACSPCTRTFPCNICILVIAVFCMSIICAYITSRYDTVIVFHALLATCIVVFICILLAFSGFDFTAWMLYIVVIAAAIGAVTMISLLVMMVTGTYMKMLHLVLLLVGTIMNVVILTMELQLVLGGGAVELGESDYALGAFLIYTAIVDIFLKLVQILGIFDEM